MGQQTEITKEVWRNYMPDYIDLYYVGYGQNLNDSHELLQECVQKNCLQPLTERVYDWWDNPEGYYLDEIKEKMTEDGLYDEFVLHEDEMKDYLWENDESTPVENLLINTSKQTFFYSLGIELDHGWHEAFLTKPWQNQSCAQSACRIRQAFGIKKDAPEADKILELCEESTYGGELRIYFKANVQDMISGDPWTDGKDKKDWQTIKFKGRFIAAVWDNTNGAGYEVELDLDKEFPFIRENLQVSDVAEQYDIESACGMCGDWLRNCGTPSFSFEKKKSGSVKISKAIAQEQEFQRLFAEGKCSPLDNNSGRHRDVYYRNDFPCGMYCPHCGKIWYD